LDRGIRVGATSGGTGIEWGSLKKQRGQTHADGDQFETTPGFIEGQKRARKMPMVYREIPPTGEMNIGNNQPRQD